MVYRQSPPRQNLEIQLHDSQEKAAGIGSILLNFLFRLVLPPSGLVGTFCKNLLCGNSLLLCIVWLIFRTYVAIQWSPGDWCHIFLITPWSIGCHVLLQKYHPYCFHFTQMSFWMHRTIVYELSFYRWKIVYPSRKSKIHRQWITSTLFLSYSYVTPFNFSFPVVLIFTTTVTRSLHFFPSLTSIPYEY